MQKRKLKRWTTWTIKKTRDGPSCSKG
jgi:hypothetical protein